MLDDETETAWFSHEDFEARQRQEVLGSSQTQTLNLKPWQVPTDEFFRDEDRIEGILAAGYRADDIGEFACATLAKQLLGAGLSLFEPDPERALHNPKYRKAIRGRVRKLKTASRRVLTDRDIDILMTLAPYPRMRSDRERADFRKLLDEQSQVLNFDLCEKLMREFIRSTPTYGDA